MADKQPAEGGHHLTRSVNSPRSSRAPRSSPRRTRRPHQVDTGRWGRGPRGPVGRLLLLRCGRDLPAQQIVLQIRPQGFEPLANGACRNLQKYRCQFRVQDVIARYAEPDGHQAVGWRRRAYDSFPASVLDGLTVAIGGPDKRRECHSHHRTDGRRGVSTLWPLYGQRGRRFGDRNVT